MKQQIKERTLEPDSFYPVRQSRFTIIPELRPKQYAKNLIIFFPLLFSGKFSNIPLVCDALACFVAFCLISSGIYVLNDVIDAEADRIHPIKRFRPVASGAVSKRLALTIGSVCLIAGFIGAYWLRPSLAFVCLSYVLLSILYMTKLKHLAILDVLCIATGFVIRAVAGAVAVRVIPSEWFLLCTTLGALFLALEKRRQELILLHENSSMHRKSLNRYSVALIGRLEALVVPTLITSYAFYSFLSEHGPWMMLTVPIVLYGLMRYQMLSESNNITGMPEDVLFKDRPIQLTIIIWVIVCALVVYGHPRAWLNSTAKCLDSYRLGP